MDQYRKKIALLAGSLVLMLCAWSQKKDYVVTQQKDTIYGVMHTGIGLTPMRLLTDTGSTVHVNANDIISYYLAEKRALYRSRRLKANGKPQFIQCLEIGRITLYGFASRINAPGPYVTSPSGANVPSPGYSEPSTVLYAERTEGTLVNIKTEDVWPVSKKNRALFLQLIADEPEVVAIYNENKRMTDADVRYYIHEYNKRAAARGAR